MIFIGLKMYYIIPHKYFILEFKNLKITRKRLFLETFKEVKSWRKLHILAMVNDIINYFVINQKLYFWVV